MATGLSIIQAATRFLNVYGEGETLPNSDAQEALAVLNDILQLWNLQRLMLYSLQDVSGILQAGHNPHTIGVAGDIVVTARPVRIESVYVRSGDTDYTLSELSSAEYQTLSRKSSEAFYPSHFMYDKAYPVGLFYVYPVASEELTLCMKVWSQFIVFASLATDAVLPPGYEGALKYQLAVDLAPKYNIATPAALVDKAAEFRRWIKAANAAPVGVVTELSAYGNGVFDIERGW
jgi:hypothetical protein